MRIRILVKDILNQIALNISGQHFCYYEHYYNKVIFDRFTLDGNNRKDMTYRSVFYFSGNLFEFENAIVNYAISSNDLTHFWLS